MYINKRFFISEKRGTHEIVTNLSGVTKVISTSDSDYFVYHRIMHVARLRKSNEYKNRQLSYIIKHNFDYTGEELTIRLFDTKEIVQQKLKDGTLEDEHKTSAYLEIKKAACKKLQDFFTEFNFTPSLRFVNTLAFVSNPREYVVNYFALQDHEYSGEISEKTKSDEWKNIIHDIKIGDVPSNKINSRLKIYYGEPGTGKTTKAMTEADKCIVCSSDMLPTDLMQNFAFSAGKAEFQKSDLWIAMENGETIILDEINMLPFESLRFLQGITDGKTELNFKGFKINIKEGFNIIGTMNLNIGSVAMGIPAPLVDRCSEIKKFNLTEEMLVNALS